MHVYPRISLLAVRALCAFSFVTVRALSFCRVATKYKVVIRDSELDKSSRKWISVRIMRIKHTTWTQT